MSNRQKQQSGPVAIATGASGGIGEATSRTLAQAGYRVFGTSRKTPPRQATGVEHVACDVTRDDSAKAAIGEIFAKTGRIDLLVNNAGIGLDKLARSNAEAVMRAVMMNADSPEMVAAAVLSASAAAKPRTRYTAGAFARQVSLLRRFVPQSAFDKSLRKQPRLPA